MSSPNRLAGCTALALVTLLSLLPSSADASPIHQYRFDGSYTDDFGGPAITPAGGTLGGGRYTFGANQGLSLSNALPSGSVYSVEMMFEFDNLSSWRKILDFKNRTSDNGLYNYFQSLTFYLSGNIGASGTDLQPNVDARVVLTRDAAGNVVGYVNGVQQFSFLDTTGAATFTAVNNIMWFFQDDFAFSGEASSGSVDYIRIYGRALTPNEVANLTNPVIPEPASVVLVGGLIVAGGAVVARRRKSSAQPA